VRGLFPKGRFFEIHVDCSLETCRRRDPKGLYAKADRGEIADFTGISSPYETPVRPEVTLHTDREGVGDAVDRLLSLLRREGILGTPRG
jgi:adenylylsulfate kinase-like enzyme